ncbi:MAG TPA: hypothetical protein VJB57_03860 [Dehalococcoidia bacterium]|nr:hypothetical protein [Dehalococcoidia bacterium]
MPLQFTHKKAEEVPAKKATGKVSAALAALMREMTKLAPDMVLEIETGDEKAIEATKMLITSAGNELGTPWQHWHQGTKVYTRPADPITERGRKQRSERANLGDRRD